MLAAFEMVCCKRVAEAEAPACVALATRTEIDRGCIILPLKVIGRFSELARMARSTSV